MLPLDGVLVVALEQAVAAPLATRHLADLGARVIKIERLDGDFARHYDQQVHGMSSHFVWLNRSKESVALDVKRAEHLAVLQALIAHADVFVQNLAPGAAQRLRLDPQTLRERHPRLVVCSVSGYGSDGPLRDLKAYDALVQAETGVVAVTGSPGEPAKAGIPVADIGAGMYAFSGILAALLQRERTGEGALVEVSLFDSLVEWMGYPLTWTRYAGAPPARSGTSHATITPYGVYAAGDGSRVMLSIQSEREWESFCCTVLQDAGLATDPRFDSVAHRLAHRAELDAVIAAILKALDGNEFLRRLDEGRIAYGRLREVAEVLEHPQLVHRGRWASVPSPVGDLAATLPAITLVGQEPAMGPVPDVGEHTAAVLAEFGLTLPPD